MATRKTKIAALAAAALILGAGAAWYIASPGWTLHQMKAAADGNDPAALDAYIDYPALREDLKADLTAQVMAEARKDQSGFGGLGAAIGAAFIGPVIDGLVTPAGMRAALTAKQDQDRIKAVPKAASNLRVPEDPVIVRHGLSEFVVTSKRQLKSGLVFKRHGLSWKLSGVDLPPVEVSESSAG